MWRIWTDNQARLAAPLGHGISAFGFGTILASPIFLNSVTNQGPGSSASGRSEERSLWTAMAGNVSNDCPRPRASGGPRASRRIA